MQNRIGAIYTKERPSTFKKSVRICAVVADAAPSENPNVSDWPIAHPKAVSAMLGALTTDTTIQTNEMIVRTPSTALRVLRFNAVNILKAKETFAPAVCFVETFHAGCPVVAR